MEQSLPLPENAIGRVGMLVALHRIKGLPDGRLGMVRHPVGWVTELLHADQPTFAWQVFLTGEPVIVHGRATQEIVVADKCLHPISQLAVADLATIVEQHERDAIQAAVAQVHSWVDSDDIDTPEFERALNLAISEAQLNHAKEVVGVVPVLSEVGFFKSHGDGDAMEWHAVFEGVEIRVDAAPGMFGDWRLCAYAIKRRSLHQPESVVLNDWPRGKLLQAVLEIWESVFGDRRIPVQLQLGWMYRQHLHDMQAIEPVLPHVDVDGVSWRRALRWLREAYGGDHEFVGPPTDLPVVMAIKDGMLQLRTDDHTIGVKLRRGWMDAMQLSLRCLIALPPYAMRGLWIRLEWTPRYLQICGHTVDRLTELRD